MKKLIIVLMFVSVPSYADKWSIEAGPGMSYFNAESDGIFVIGQYDTGPINVIAAAWKGERDNYALGLAKRFKRGKWSATLGAVYAKYNDNRLGTHGNFIICGHYYFKENLYTGPCHISNGDQLFDNGNNYGREGNNRGEDTWTVGYSW